MRRPNPRDDRGASSVEYGLVVAAVAAVIVAILIVFGGLTVDMFSDTCQIVASESRRGSC